MQHQNCQQCDIKCQYLLPFFGSVISAPPLVSKIALLLIILRWEQRLCEKAIKNKLIHQRSLLSAVYLFSSLYNFQYKL